MPMMCEPNGTAQTNGKDFDAKAQNGHPEPVSANKDLDYDVLIIGAGLSGIYSLYQMRQLGMRARVLEAGEAEGGTWFW